MEEPPTSIDPTDPGRAPQLATGDLLAPPPVASSGPPPVAPSGRRRPARRGVAVIGLGLALGIVVVAIVAWQGGRRATLSAPSPSAGGAIGARTPPLIAFVDPAGGLATIDATGHRTQLSTEAGVVYGFPAWSPDGTRIAAVRNGDDAAISIFAIPAAGSTGSSLAPPTVLYRSSSVPPFYLYWTPDGQRVSFLATESDGISLRIAPVDGSAPLDGSGPGAVIRRGTPLYFDWIGADRLVLHVGIGTAAFLGEVGLDGAAVSPAVENAGDFRSPMVGADGRYLAYVRGPTPTAALVVAARDGSAEQNLPVFGPTAAVFDPTGATVAAIAADQPGQPDAGFPLGPLRLLDAAAGTTRTLLDGSVIAFFWSPDGKTIAALRLQRGSGSTVADGGIVAAAALAEASPSPSPTTAPGTEVHLVFLDVATGTVRSDRVVRLGNHFVGQFLPYFDQYALSHRVWAPDSSSLLLPLLDAAGGDQLVSVAPDGSAGPPPIDAESGFWSP